MCITSSENPRLLGTSRYVNIIYNRNIMCIVKKKSKIKMVNSAKWLMIGTL